MTFLSAPALSCRWTHSGLPLTEGSFYQSPLLSFWGPCCPASDFPLVSVCSLFSFFCERHGPALKSPSCFRNQLQVHICHSCSLSLLVGPDSICKTKQHCLLHRQSFSALGTEDSLQERFTARDKEIQLCGYCL